MTEYTERDWYVSDEDEIKRIREYIAALKAELKRVRATDPVEFWFDEMARLQRKIQKILDIKPRNRTDEQKENLVLFREEYDNAVLQYRLAREPKRTWYDITGDVVWAQTNFTQVAKTGPGSFQITLKGNHPEFRSGEEIHFDIDDLRTFGGWVTSVERGYFFEDAVAPRTILRGTDFNILFDRLAVRNYPAELVAHADTRIMIGPYKRWPDFAQGTLDSEMIDTVFGTYVLPDLPIGFDYESGVDTVDTPAPVAPWAMPQSGSALRRFMSSVSQITSAVWSIDATMALQYHDRETVTAPFPITDGFGGISSNNLTIKYDISSMVNDVFVWGTLAKTVEGEIMVWHEEGDIGFWERYYLGRIETVSTILQKLLAIPSSKRTAKQKRRIENLRDRLANLKAKLQSARDRAWDPGSDQPRPNNAIVNSIDTWGRWQQGEFREDIHHQEWVRRRAHSILTRYDEPIITATATIWDPGYQAGQVVTVLSQEHDLAVDLVIRQMSISFSVPKEPHDGYFYALPKYDLEMGLEPESPWNIYDYLPFPGENTPGLGGDNA
jgi:hypothetical protein